jgi:hypothetical protein
MTSDGSSECDNDSDEDEFENSKAAWRLRRRRRMPHSPKWVRRGQVPPQNYVSPWANQRS